MITAEELLDILHFFQEKASLYIFDTNDIDWIGVDGYIDLEKLAQLINNKLEQKT